MSVITGSYDGVFVVPIFVHSGGDNRVIFFDMLITVINRKVDRLM